MYDLNLEEVCGAVKKFNENPNNLATDYIVAKQFAGQLERSNKDQVLYLVITLDNLFHTQLEAREIFDITENIKIEWKRICDSLNNIRQCNLLENPCEIYGVAKETISVIFDTTKRKNYSFATKFLHWCTREHFPIMDSKSRIAIRNFQKKKNYPEEDMIYEEKDLTMENKIEEYNKWIKFYSTLFTHNAKILNQIQECDNQTQGYPLFRIENTSLRILDKYFYIKGLKKKKLNGVRKIFN